MIDTKDPKFLAFWTKMLREGRRWSQEALAEASGLDVRTIQRIEAGKGSASVTTRRTLATGLGYSNPDAFDDPEFIKGVCGLFDEMSKIQAEERQKQFPGHVRVAATKASSAEDLSRIAYEGNAYLFHADEALPEEAKDIAADVFDFLRDLGDVADDLSFADRLEQQRSLGEYLRRLEAAEAACYSAFRKVKAVGENWIDKTPWAITVAYLNVVPAAKVVTELMVPRRLS